MTSPKLDFTFDQRVADQYDAQRAHPPEVAKQVGHSIARIVGSDADVLELGVGTGRIALPVAAAGCAVTGIDISGDMLAQVHNNKPEQNGRLGLVRGDITRLPFQPDSFDALTAVHVLHLVEEWEQLLADASSALRTQAHFIMGRDWVDPESMSGILQMDFRRAVMELAGSQLRKPPPGQAQFAAKLEEFGFLPEQAGEADIVAAEWEIQLSPAEFIAAVRQRANPESWILTDELMEPVAARLEAVAAEKWPNLEEGHTVKRRFLLSVFRRH